MSSVNDFRPFDLKYNQLIIKLTSEQSTNDINKRLCSLIFRNNFSVIFQTGRFGSALNHTNLILEEGMLLEYTLILHCSFHCSFCKVSLVSLPQISGSFYSRAASTSFAVKQKAIAREIRWEILREIPCEIPFAIQCRSKFFMFFLCCQFCLH